MRRCTAILALVALAAWTGPATAQDGARGGGEIPRKVLALYDGEMETPRNSSVHSVAQMPLNHLGLAVELHDVREGLPSVETLAGYRGILSWVYDRCTDDPAGYLDWASRAVDEGLRFVIIAHPCADVGPPGVGVALDDLNRFLGRLGFERGESGSGLAHAVEVLEADPAMIGFERPLPAALPSYHIMRPTRDDVTSYLVLGTPGKPDSRSHAVMTSERGGYIASGYVVSESYAQPPQGRQLYVDLFAFFAKAFGTHGMPVPDTTTLSGRRTYFSHIDGDGWNSVSLIKGYVERQAIAAEVILEEIIRPHPELPVTVGPVAGDLDPDWYGIEQSIPVARRIFALPQVEAASHTYSHPYEWGFFENYDPAREHRFLESYPPRPDGSSGVYGWPEPPADTDTEATYDPPPDAVHDTGSGVLDPIAGIYALPRSYAVTPFDLDFEIAGSIAFIDGLLPPGKKVEALLWSGNTEPFPEALAAARRAGVVNLNGGDSRFDSDNPSYTWVAPLGFGTGGEHQNYTGAANEYFYTIRGDRERVGFWKLPDTLKNTETPIRLRPINLYYHMFSGERLGELNAIKSILAYVGEQEIAPITASRYSAIVDGFRSARLIEAGERRWRIEDRGALQTLRFDRATTLSVDFERSTGVIGQRHHQGSLYVALDEAVAAPVVALREALRTDRDPPAPRPYLVHGRWQVFGLETGGRGFGFTAQGFGPGRLVWQVPRPGTYTLTVAPHEAEPRTMVTEAGADGRLPMDLGAADQAPVRVTVSGPEDPS